MKYLKFFIVLLLLGGTTSMVSAQSDYKTSVGLRFGVYTYGNASLKHFISDQAAIEAYLGVRSFGVFGFRYARFELGALYQHHLPLEVDIPGNLRWYVGAGPYIGLSTGTIDNGIDLGGMAGPGLDYAFEDLPINVSFDLYLGVQLVRSFGVGFRQGGLSVRYIFQ